VDYGTEGSFCGGKCGKDDDCPWGFSCSEAMTVDGIGTVQCVADAGVCPCTSKSVDLALWTPCEVQNEHGTCEGKRGCQEGGLSVCDAATPASEACNGVDDDCDGEVDEGTCDDELECTSDSCLGAAGCDHVPVDGGECKDGNPCTVADHCAGGACVGTPVQCDDQNPCTDDSCNEAGGCLFLPNAVPCDDGDPCTVKDECDVGACGGFAVDCACKTDAECAALEDSDLCNGTLRCATDKLPYQCVVDPATEVMCSEPGGDDAFCLQGVCDPATGKCSTVPAHEGLPCDDGDACTVTEKCAGGVCSGGVAVNCNDGNPCTQDGCAPADGCFHTANQAPCNDGNACTTGDACAAGSCSGGPSLDCDDGNSCTDDGCDPGVGCTHADNSGECGDGNACTVGDACNGGQCVPGKKMLSCNDSNPCTDDVCDPEDGCTYTVNSAPCDDGNVCTLKDQCAVGKCLGGTPVSCDDLNPCTTDSCDGATGCVHQAAAGACDDGNTCTTDDSCANALCIPGPALSCDDSNECTTDSCDKAMGCQHVNKPDSTACQGGGKWACLSGKCSCTPQCSGKECGDDGCAGSCGDCGQDKTCNQSNGKCYPSGGVVFGPYTWYLGPRGGNCLGVCEAHGLSCANIVASGWTESCPNTVCSKFFQGLGCQNDGDGPRLSAADVNGQPTGSSKCICHDHNWGGWSCAWQQRPDDVRICPCQ